MSIYCFIKDLILNSIYDSNLDSEPDNLDPHNSDTKLYVKPDGKNIVHISANMNDKIERNYE